MDKSNEFNEWHDNDDIRRDLFQYSDLPYPGDEFTSAPPKSINEYRARTTQVKNSGLFSECRQDVEVFVSGRGRYIKDRILKPGEPAESTLEDDCSIEKKIREVSGLGYANEIIEKAFEDKDSDMDIIKIEHNSDHIETPNLKLIPSTASCFTSSEMEYSSSTKHNNRT